MPLIMHKLVNFTIKSIHCFINLFNANRLLIWAKICALMTHIWYDLCTKGHSNHLTWPKSYTLETYLRFKGRKGCKLNHFKFWKIKKRLNEKISESKLMDHEKRQDKDIMSFENEKWPLWSKKECKKTWKIRHEQDSTAWKFRTQKI